MSKLSTPRSSSTTHRPDTHPHTHTEGLTLIEILVALAVSGLILTLVLGITNSSRALYEADQVRTAINQNLRTAMDLIGSDVRVAGQGMVGSTLNAISVSGGNELVIRTAPVDLAPLKVCDELKAGNKEATIALFTPGNNFTNCDEKPELQAISDDWEVFRNAQGGAVRVLIIADDGNSEFFTYNDQPVGNVLNVPVQDHRWQNYYHPDINNPFLYILEERRYQFDSATGRLQLIVNGQDPIDLINNVTDFQIAVIMPDGTRIEDFGDDADETWTDIASVEISVTGAATRRGADAPTERTLTSNFYARNIRSRE